MSARTVRVRPSLAVLALAWIPACEPEEVTEIAVDVAASHLTGAFTLDGGAFPESEDESGDLTLAGALPGDEFFLGRTVDQGYDTFVVDGVYDARYWFAYGGAVVPTNPGAAVLEAQGVGGDATVDVEVGAVAITATFSLNGGPFPASQYDSAAFYLQRAGTDDLVLLGDSHQGGGAARVVPGTYHVVYDHRSGSGCPVNAMARVAQDLELTTDQALDLDVLASSLRLTLTLDGGPFPVSEYQDATLHLRDGVTGAESTLMNTHAPVPNALVIDGTYDVIYRHETGDEVPLNTAAVLVDDLVHNGGGALFHDIVSVTVDAEVTLDGAPFPVSEYDDGIVSLHDPRSGADTTLGNTHDPFVGLVLIPGTYDVMYGHETGDDVPQNARGRVATDVVVDGGLLEVDVLGVRVEADVTLDGEPFPASEYDDALFVLSGDPGDEDIVLGNSHDADPLVLVLAGTYDLYYRHETGDAVPQNANYRWLADQDLQEDTTLVADLESRSVRVSATLNGQPFPGADVGAGRILAGTGAGDDVLVLETGSAGDAVLLVPGDYTFVYAYTDGDEVPVNLRAAVAAITVE